MRDLSHLTVLELSTSPGPAFAANLLADFGARVIVVEAPPLGSALRRLGPPAVQQVWWPIIARNKLSVALDAEHEDAGFVIGEALRHADIVIRDDAASVWMEAACAMPAPPLDLHIFPTGADRPEEWGASIRPEFAVAASGAMALTGDPDCPPVQPEFPLADYSAGMLAAAGALLELAAAAKAPRQPASLEVGLHEALMRMNEWQLVIAAAKGAAEQRSGNRYPMNANIGNIFRTGDGGLITISAATASVADRLLDLIGGQALREDPRFNTYQGRRENMDALELVIADWMLRHGTDDILAMGRAHDVVMAPIFDARRLRQDAQAQARGNICEVPLSGGGSIAMPGIVPAMTGVTGAIRHAGPEIGADTDAVLASFGVSAARIAALRHGGAIWR
jgi:crotonobetainyl-CoA:carnitine CoA-transferase CaiB-like acyl-CoA transferase